MAATSDFPQKSNSLLQEQVLRPALVDSFDDKEYQELINRAVQLKDKPADIPVLVAAVCDESFQDFLWMQILRIKQNLQETRVDGVPTNQGVHAMHVRHSAGKKKPSLSQMELEGMPWRLPNEFRK